ncbi:MAG: efflux RND transporter periplasmic adaptor subunit, partial [Gemmataceae bacterium]|nr:efflux RND transporter periplasmic adaptor subunit [Gemmataceae bacterium]
MSITRQAGDQFPTAPGSPPPPMGWAAWTLHNLIPNILILAALATLGWWGHHTGWKLPKFSELSGAAGAEENDWCKEHAVPESICVECRPKEFPRHKTPGWCEEHGVHECPLDHPRIAQLPSLPVVTPAMRERARRALAFADRPENDSRCKLHLRRVQFASEQAVAKAGVEVAPAWERPVTESIQANAEAGYDQTRVARVSSPVAGVVRRVERAVGDRVRPGELLAVLDAADVGKAKAEFLQARAQAEARAKALDALQGAGGAVPEVRVREAEAAALEGQIRQVAAEQALANLGLPLRAAGFAGLATDEAARRARHAGFSEAEAKRLKLDDSTANLFPIRAPQEGVVVAREREAVLGTVVEANKPLFVVADTRRMWLTLSVRQEDARRLRPLDPVGKGRRGQAVRFRASGLGEASGELDWVSTAVD